MPFVNLSKVTVTLFKVQNNEEVRQISAIKCWWIWIFANISSCCRQEKCGNTIKTDFKFIILSRYQIFWAMSGMHSVFNINIEFPVKVYLQYKSHSSMKALFYDLIRKVRLLWLRQMNRSYVWCWGKLVSVCLNMKKLQGVKGVNNMMSEWPGKKCTIRGKKGGQTLLF